MTQPITSSPVPTMNAQAQMGWAVGTTAQRQGFSIGSVQMNAALSNLGQPKTPTEDLERLINLLGFKKLAWIPLDRARLPLLAWTGANGWVVITDQMPDGQWVAQLPNTRLFLPDAQFLHIAHLNVEQQTELHIHHRFRDLLKATLARYRGVMAEAMLATLFVNFLTMAASLFSMQVYDRVIPTRSTETLVTLAVGVTLIIMLELAMKIARSRIMDPVVIGTDSRLSREIFQRMLNIRIDQLPKSVGSLASQIRGYEQVRSFYTASTLFALVDLPTSLMFVVVIGLIGSVWLTAIPILTAFICLMLGLSARSSINALALKGAKDANMKTGLLVEAVEGVETIKAGNGAWKFLSRWIELNNRTITQDVTLRHKNENLAYFVGTMQQLSYAGLIVGGAVLVMDGEMTMGALIACSILSGRVLAPIMAIPGLLVQQSHAKAAIDGLEALYDLKVDNDGINRPLIPSVLRGSYQLTNVQFEFLPKLPALTVQQLNISPGERIAVLGPIGSGKTTLLRMLAGLYPPTQGRILLDGLDMTHISQQVLSQQIGYLQQDHRLFAGTLRENLLIGMPDPGDDALRDVMNRSGLMQLVAAHPLGLDLPIFEGGKGLSGGQRQLVAFTRILLMKPSILLLDEPTASMDDAQEQRCLQALANELLPETTLIIVTHKMSVMPLIKRILVVNQHQIAISGPRDDVLLYLRDPQAYAKRQAQASQQTQAPPPQLNIASNPPAPTVTTTPAPPKP